MKMVTTKILDTTRAKLRSLARQTCEKQYALIDRLVTEEKSRKERKK